MRSRILLACSVLGVLVLSLFVVAFANVVFFLEASVPPRDDLPDLPDGLSIINETSGCGSGNCFRTFEVVGDDGETPEEVAARLPDEEDCSAHSLIDRRPLCVGYEVRPDGVHGYVALGKWLS